MQDAAYDSLLRSRRRELRAAADLARRLAGRGERTQAREMLREVYGRFTEGFETPDLRAARRILAEIGDAPAGRRSAGDLIGARQTQKP